METRGAGNSTGALVSVKFLIDMNLSPDWIRVLGNVFTHDLDFGTVLALTHATGPSVFQIRAQDLLRGSLEQVVIAALQQHEADLASGALVVVDQSGTRARVLPMIRFTD